ncbi:MAG: integrase [Rhodobacteraceae bacterium]|nr:integrase [Paracoccaceae bacterium]MBR28817.1 integrase [Paracoccaceae bacterium]
MPRKRLPARLYQRPDTGEWIIRDGHVTRRTGCGDGDRAGAEAALQAYLATRAPARRRGPAAPHELTVGEVLARYGADRGPKAVGKVTMANNITRLAGFWGDLTCDLVKGSTCTAYERHRAKPRTNAAGQTFTAGTATVRRELGVLQAALRYAHAEGMLVHPIQVTLTESGLPRDRWLTRSEAARILRAAAPHARRFILLSLYTGRRMSAVLELTWARVDLERGVARFREDGQRETKKRRGECRLPRQLANHLRRWKALARPGETHVVAFRGRPVASIKTAVRRACERAEITEDVTQHALKHTAITWAMMAGLDVEDAAEYFDTSPATIRNHYWHHSPNHQARGVAAMERRR